ncbi:tRNA-uridine aminocarboxypropyltransferase [Bradyrhizobium sp. SYSU BS000235]|uniref:tRNA-uridine aminocarboxypropyltransferase n=1 Tax=Bradyrhizobium sp. SYSU BS000235 TaxID=3411332 RepID=UPI003C741288
MSPHAKPEVGKLEPEEIPECPHCGKPEPLCVCSDIAPIDNRIELLILQHPQEQDRALGTARLTALHFQNAALKIGLSWPSLSKVLGRSVDPQRWAILYLGSAKVEDLATDSEVVAIDRKGAIEDGQRSILNDIEGVILLDGTWSQAKALWWRNAWMLKCRRIILGPARPSLYGKLRKEPRGDGLSTLEAAALVLSRLEKRPEIETALTASFEKQLARFREVQATMPELAPKPRKRDYRRPANRRGKSALAKS